MPSGAVWAGRAPCCHCAGRRAESRRGSTLNSTLNLLEREREASALWNAVEAARGGAGRLVLVEGPAGVGKSSLLEAVAARAADAGVRVLRARGTELERDFPFGVVRQLFEPVAGPDVIAAPEGEGDPSFAVLNGLFWMTANLAEDEPLVLVVDDAHWADAASLRYLRFLLPRLGDLSVAVLAAGRPEGDEVAALAADPATTSIRPQVLSPAAVARLVRDARSPDASDALCAACHTATGGNPLLLRELLAELRTDEPDAVAAIAPAAITRSVLVRLGREPADAQAMARAIAVLGDDADPALAAELAEADQDTADALVAVGVLAPARPLRYLHPVLRTAVYADIPPAELAAAHARAAALLTARGAPPERVAVHLLATDPSGDATVVETLASAARRSLDQGAPEHAVRFLRRALREPATDETRPGLVHLLLVAALRAGDSTAGEGVAEDPLDELAGDDETLVASAWELVMVLLATGRVDEVRPLVDRATAVADTDTAVRIEGLLASSNLVSPAEGRERLARYEVTPGSAGERLSLALRAWWGTFLGAPAEECAGLAMRALADGRIFAEQIHAPPPGQAVMALARAEHLDAALEGAERLRAEAERHGSATALAQAAHVRAIIALLAGDVTRAEVETRFAVEVARRGGFLAAAPVFVGGLVEALIERDELAAAEAELESLGWTGAVPDGYWWATVLNARAELRLAQHRLDDAAADLRAMQRSNDAQGITSPFYSVGARLALAVGDEEALAKETELAQAWGTKTAIATTQRVRGLLGDDLGALGAAVDTLRGTPMRLDLARALADHGAALRRANRRLEARERLRESLDLARTGGALRIARRAHDELEASGEKQRPLLATGVESLTPSERRVVDLAIEGMTNREIAQALFLTVKTVETHLSRAYRKLDITSRDELPRALS